MLTLNYNVFTDVLFNRFNIFFDVILEEDHVMMLLPHMLKSGRDNPRPGILQKHSVILHAMLQHVTYSELSNLSDSMDRRTSITIRLCELALKRLTDVTFTEVRPRSVLTWHAFHVHESSMILIQQLHRCPPSRQHLCALVLYESYI